MFGTIQPPLKFIDQDEDQDKSGSKDRLDQPDS